ncbi:MAG: nitrogenase [Cyanothece sp. SIO1E1]|nr:nitrogenase [Cyanothece sp. SIO1E1]
MTRTVESPYTSEQIAVWLRGLMAIAWADGHFDDEEKDLIASLTQEQLAPNIDLGEFEPIEPSELAAVLGQDEQAADNFLRTAVMVAIADGVYSAQEDETLQAFSEALGREVKILESLRLTLYNHATQTAAPAGQLAAEPGKHVDLLKPTREWLDQLEVHDPRVARFLCKLIPAQCPFERDVELFGRKIVHIPAMCKINPLYEQLVGLRFRALSYLADDCGEDVTEYC